MPTARGALSSLGLTCSGVVSVAGAGVLDGEVASGVGDGVAVRAWAGYWTVLVSLAGNIASAAACACAGAAATAGERTTAAITKRMRRSRVVKSFIEVFCNSAGRPGTGRRLSRSRASARGNPGQ